MARARHRKPNRPAGGNGPDLLPNADLIVVEIDNPLAPGPGDRIVALRSLRGDPLGRLQSHHQIDSAQFAAGRAFQRDWEMAERGPQAIDPGRVHVDGVPARQAITEAQRQAVQRLNRAERELGPDGAALVHDVLVNGMGMAEVAQRRGLETQRWKDYFSRRLIECLDRLALVYGLTSKQPAMSPTSRRSR